MHTLYRKQLLNDSVENVWAFFTSPTNLSKITPTHLDFCILNKQVIAVTRPGLIIHYTIKPFFNIPMHWTTEITHVVPHFLFVDEQRKGPYAFWHHQHLFTQQQNGVLMEDIVTYSLPAGIIGRFVNKVYVEKTLQYIFDYRAKMINTLFNNKSDELN